MSESKKITLSYEGKDYTLEYDRRAVKMMERRGFNIGELESKPVTLLPQLFWGAFQKHHRNISQDTTDQILESLGSREALYGKLTEMYSEVVLSLFDEASKKTGKKMKWEPNW